MEKVKTHFCNFTFRKENSKTYICAFYGYGAIAESIIRKLFARFRSESFDLKAREQQI